MAQQFMGAGASPPPPAAPPPPVEPRFGGAPQPAAATQPSWPAAQPYSEPPDYRQPPAPGAAPPWHHAQPYGAGPAPQSGFDQLGLLLQALQQRQIPPLPGSPAAAAPTAPTAPQPDALSMLRLILTNPHFQQTLHATAGMGAAGPRAVPLSIPAPSYPARMRSVPIPLGAVMNAIAALAGQTMVELNEGTREDEPEVPSYLVDEQGEFIVDPATPEDRAALVAHLFRVSDEAQRSEQLQDPGALMFESDEQLDESELWARETGFSM